MLPSPYAIGDRDASGAPGSPPRKRAKRGTSCLDCRRRKLKCDGQQPACSRCIRGGIAATCNYDANARAEHEDETLVTHSERPWSFQQWTPITNDSTTPLTHNCVRRGSNTHAGENGSTPAQLANSQEQRIERLEQRISQLTDMVAELSSPRGHISIMPKSKSTTQVLTPHNPVHTLPPQAPHAPSTRVSAAKSRGFKTNFWGPSHSMSITSEVCVALYSVARY